MAFVEGDTASKFRITCKDNASGGVIDLTGSTVTLKWRDQDGELQTRSMTLIDPANGVVEYQFGAGDLYAVTMRFEVEITNAAGYVLRSLELLAETVREMLA